MNNTTLKIDKELHIYIPKHKQNVQIFRRNADFDVTIEVEIEGEIEVKITDFGYDFEKLDYDVAWEGNTEIVDGEEVELTVEQYLYKTL